MGDAPFFVELGAGECTGTPGRECTTRLLRERGWAGLAVDAEHETETVTRATLASGTVAQLLRGHGVPRDLDLLVVDLDYGTYWVLRAALRAGFRPAVVDVEINPVLWPELRLTVPALNRLLAMPPPKETVRPVSIMVELELRVKV